MARAFLEHVLQGAQNSASETTCIQSIRRSIFRFGSLTLPIMGISTAIPMPGTMIKNSQCQLDASVIQPPSDGPSVGAKVETMPSTAGTIARCLPWNSVKPVREHRGHIAPPTKPGSRGRWSSTRCSHAMPHIRLEIVNRTAESVNSQRVDSACDRNAASGIITISP